MCVRVHRSNHITTVWDPSSRTITIPAHFCPAIEDKAIRAVLTELAVIQPPAGAICWCGAPVVVPPNPHQRHTEVTAHGA